MKLDRLLFLMIAAGAVGTACGAEASSPSAGGAGGAGGVGGSGGALETSTAGTTSSGQSGSGTDGVGSSATSGGNSGGGGAFPTDCAETGSCGNFGGGCIKCASKVACSVEYHACFDNAPCKFYSSCIEQCGPKDLDCLQQCENQNPGGAAEYQALIHCVICGDCATLCEHAPDTCK